MPIQKYLYLLECMRIDRLGFTLGSYANSYVAVLISMMILAVGTGIHWPNSNLWVIDRVPLSHRGRTISYIYTFAFFGQFVAPFIGTPLVEELGIRGTYRLSGSVFGLMSLCHLYFRFIK